MIEQSIKAIFYFALGAFLILSTLSSDAQQSGKPRKHAMPMAGMQMGHENHTPASDLRNALVGAWNSNDTTKVADLFGESAVIILPSGKLITGRQSIREFFQRQMPANARVTFTSIGFDSSSDLQVDYGVFTKPGTARPPNNQPHSHNLQLQIGTEGKYLMVVKRTNSDWKIHEMVFVFTDQGL